MLWLVSLVPIASALALYATSSDRRRVLACYGVLSMALTLALAIIAATGDWTGRFVWSPAIALTTGLTPLSGIVLVVVPAVALAVLLYAAMHEPRPGLNRLVTLMLFFVGAMQLLVMAEDLLTLLIGWELVGACSWALISQDWRERDHLRAGAQAFLMTRSGDLGLFIAAAAAFTGTGSFAYADLGALEGPLLHLLVFGVVLSASAKSAQLPFSIWLFSAMAGPTSVSALLHAATMVAAGAFLLARLHSVLDVAAWFAPTVIAIGLVTALAGGIVALLQPHAKKLLAASTSAHYGLMFAATGAGYPAVAIMHFTMHAFFKALLFLAAGIAGAAAGRYSLRAMRFGYALPVTAALTAVGALALAGVPPLGGAWSKEAVTAAAGHASHWAALAVILAGGLSACYALRFQWLAFGRHEESSQFGDGGAERSEDDHGTDDEGAPRGERDVERPGWPILAALALLAAPTLILSLLWVPSIEGSVGRLLGAEFPRSPAWELSASLVAVLLGIYAARVLATRRPALGADGTAAGLADWFALPRLLRVAVVEPGLRLARALAHLDDRVIDRVPAGIGRSGTIASSALTHLDDRVIDRLPVAIGRSGTIASSALARADGAAVDGGVRLTARFSTWLAQASATFAETLVDGLPEGTARLLGAAGMDARRVQTGLSHHYYALIAIGTAMMMIILFLAR